MTQVEPRTIDVRDILSILYAPIRTELDEVERRLANILGSNHPQVDEIIRYGIRLSGKRLRPSLLLLSGKAVGELCEDHVVLGAVLEMIHTATLVHDDVLDEASLRRHVDTVNARWNNETSVLLGDFLFTQAFYLASSLESTLACRTIGQSTNIVCEGELRQTATRGDLELSEEDYFAIIDAKTAELCACCCQLGAAFADGSPEAVRRITSFGRNLGLAFQIADDLLDLLGQENETGKSLGTDVAKRKMTLPLIHARDGLSGAERAEFLELVGQADEIGPGSLLARLEELGSLDYASERAKQHSDRAQDDLADLPESTAKDSLLAMATFVVARTA
jgi:octaprenyl-diphosphate synthase